jgi:hypothetical protein
VCVCVCMCACSDLARTVYPPGRGVFCPGDSHPVRHSGTCGGGAAGESEDFGKPDCV